MSLNTTHTNWITGSYATDVLFLLKVGENNTLRLHPTTNIKPQLDNGNPVSLFIGYGYDLVGNKATAYADLVAAGATITNAPQLQNILATLTRPVSPATRDAIGALVSLPNEPAATTLLGNTIATSEAAFSARIKTINGGTDIPQSNERAALMDLWYQSPGKYFGIDAAHPTNLTNAIVNDNRAEAWFQIRYGSAANGGGVIPRRYVDSQLFGLYDNASNPTYADATQAYETLTAHRSTIVAYEVQNGTDPDAANASSVTGQIAVANSIYKLYGTANQVQTLAQEYAAAEAAVITAVKADSPLLSSLTTAFARSTDIFVANNTNKKVDAGVGDGLRSNFSTVGLDEAGSNHIVLGTGDGDTLIGGYGQDVIVAGTGSETLNGGHGFNTLVGGNGNDVLYGNGYGDVLDFEFGNTVGRTEKVIESAGLGLDQLYVNGQQLGTGITATGTPETWSGGGNQYTYIANPQSAPAGSTGGELQVLVGGTNGNEIDIYGFNLQTAQTAAGFLGIKLPPVVNLTAGATIGTDPPANFLSGSEQSYTISVDAPSSSAQTVTLTLSGAPASDFEVMIGQNLVPLSANGSFTVTLPAGQTNIAFELLNTTALAQDGTLVLSASIANPSNPNGAPVTSTPLTIDYQSAPPDTSTPPQPTNTITGTYNSQTSITSYMGDGGNDSIVAASPNDYIQATNSVDDSIIGGSGSNTIDGGSGHDVINLNGTQDAVSLGHGYNTVNGGTGHDTVFGDGTAGTLGNDITAATPSDDIIMGNGGTDLLFAGSGSNQIFAGAQSTVQNAIASLNSVGARRPGCSRLRQLGNGSNRPNRRSSPFR